MKYYSNGIQRRIQYREYLEKRVEDIERIIDEYDPLNDSDIEIIFLRGQLDFLMAELFKLDNGGK